MTAQQTLGEALELELPPRTHKPRTDGMTMVMDIGWPVQFTADCLNAFGEYLDVVKLWDTHLRMPVDEVVKKIKIYQDAGVLVQPGGIFLEMARAQGNASKALKSIATMGFDLVEISATASSGGRSLVDDAQLIREAKSLGMGVYGEVGEKFAEGDRTRKSESQIDIERTVEEMEALLEAGADRVYWEGHLLRLVVGDDPETINGNESTGCEDVREVVRRVGATRIFFEVSALRPLLNRRSLQFWLIKEFGPTVNLANARLEELPHLEALRAGHHPIFGFGQAGNYPWLKSVIRDGKGADRWWETKA